MDVIISILFWAIFGAGAIGMFVIALILALWWVENRNE